MDVFLLDVDGDPALTSPSYNLPTLFIEIDAILQPRDYDVLLTFANTVNPVAEAATLMRNGYQAYIGHAGPMAIIKGAISFDLRISLISSTTSMSSVKNSTCAACCGPSGS